MAGKRRRSQIEIVEDKIAAIELKIEAKNAEIAKLNEEKDALTKTLQEAIEEERRVEEEKTMKSIAKIIKEKGITAEELKIMLEKSEA